MVDRLEKVFGGWAPGAPMDAVALPAVNAIAGVQRRDVPMGGKVQCDLMWGVHSLKRHDPDYYAAMVGNMALGQLGMGGRLSDNVRERQGMAYYVYSSLEADLEAGLWLASAGVSPANVERALDAILSEVERFKAHGPTAEELADVRAFLTGSLVLGLETNGGIASALLMIERYGLGLDYVLRYPEIIHGVGHDDVVRVARQYLSTENYGLSVAGPSLSVNGGNI
jgi:zinc protease